jgi:hypothetical protein
MKWKTFSFLLMVRNAHKIVAQKPEDATSLRDVVTNMKIILKWSISNPVKVMALKVFKNLRHVLLQRECKAISPMCKILWHVKNHFEV